MLEYLNHNDGKIMMIGIYVILPLTRMRSSMAGLHCLYFGLCWLHRRWMNTPIKHKHKIVLVPIFAAKTVMPALPHLHQWAWWLPMTLSLVHHCSFLGPLLIGTDHCRQGTPLKSYSFGDALTQWCRHHILTLVKQGQHVHLLSKITHPLTGAMIKSYLSVMSLHLAMVIMLCLIGVYPNTMLICKTTSADI